MFSQSIPGLSKIIEGEIRPGYNILLTGAAGTMKTALAFTAMNGMLKTQKGKYGVYATLEETHDDHMWNMESFHIAPHPNLKILDIANFKFQLKNAGGYSIASHEYFELILKALQIVPENPNTQNKAAHPLCYTLDSLNALISLSRIEPSNKREFIHDLFTYLKRSGIISLIIWESAAYSNDEYFIADGVIELGINRINSKNPTRYIIVHKLKGVKHSLHEHHIDVGKNGVEIVGRI